MGCRRHRCCDSSLGGDGRRNGGLGTSEAKKAGFITAKAASDTYADKAGIANEGPDSSLGAEQEAQRAYPADSVPTDAVTQAQATYTFFKKHGKKVGQWSSIGPSKATYPAVLNPFLFDGAPYVASGRVTAMAIAPNCSSNDCRLYVGAAGGGVWTTDKALEGDNQHWTFTSGGFGTNAIGSLLIDPRDPSGNTVYAGTGEPNASGDSEAGVGIYKTTDGGDTWALVPGSDICSQRRSGQLALDNAGNLLVPIASGVRGISSVTGGSLSSASTTCSLQTRGLWRQTGATFTLIWPSPAPVRGSTRVEVDPTHAGVIYVNAFQQGIWRSTDNGATFSQIKAPQIRPGAWAIDRSRVRRHDAAERHDADVRRRRQPGRLPVTRSNFYRSDNAAGRRRSPT